MEETNNAKLPLQDRIMQVLSLMKKGSPNEIAIELMELQGISTEEGVEELAVETEEELEKLCEAGVVERIKEHRQKTRYRLPGEE